MKKKNLVILIIIVPLITLLVIYITNKYGDPFYIFNNFRYTYTRRNSILEETFPPVIPRNVKAYKFHRSILPLQGGTDIVLYYIDENINIDEFNEKYKKGATFIGNYNEFDNHDDIMMTAFNYTSVEYDDRKQDFIIYIYSDRCDDSGYCNHGTLIMNAINPQTKEVVHQYSDW